MPQIINRSQLTTSGVVDSTVYIVDQSGVKTSKQTVINVAALVSGTVVYTLKYSYETGVSPTQWFSWSDMTDATGNVDSEIAKPITALQLSQTSGDGAVTCFVTVQNIT